MKLSQFNYPLPEDKTAKYPAKYRDESRLMVLNRKDGSVLHKSFKDIEPTMISAILDWMKPTQSSDGSGAYELDKNAKIELTMVARQFMEDLGQQTLAI